MRCPPPGTFALGAAILLAALAACRTVSRPRAVRPAAEHADGYYEAGGAVPRPAAETLYFRGAEHEVWRILLPSRVPDDLRHLSHVEDPIEILLFRPRRLGGTARPLVLISPILANSLLLMNEFATGFTRQGMVAAIVMRKEFTFDPGRALEQAEGEFRAYVMQGRQALDYLVTRPEVDARRLATFGVSAGAIVSACLAGADARFKAHVFVLAGGPLADVMADTGEDRFVEYRAAVERTTGLSGDTLRERLRAEIATDPVKLAAGVDPESVLLFLARRDTSIPIRHGWTLWEALGRPRLVLLPFGHGSSFVFLPWIVDRASRFLAARLGDD